MFNWTANYVNTDLKKDLDYVFISFYEDEKDCPILSKNPKTDTLTWIKIFEHLGKVFTSDDAGKGKLGFGEFGPQCHECESDRSCCQRNKKEFITRYYSTYHKGIVAANTPKYIGGFFYWYFYQDMVKYENKDAFKEMQRVAKAY